MPRYRYDADDEAADKKKKPASPSPSPTVPQKTTATYRPQIATTERRDYDRTAEGDEKAARYEEREKKAAALRAAAAKTAKPAEPDDDPEPQAKSYKSLAEYAAKRKAWLERRKTKAAAQKEALK